MQPFPLPSSLRQVLSKYRPEAYRDVDNYAKKPRTTYIGYAL